MEEKKEKIIQIVLAVFTFLLSIIIDKVTNFSILITFVFYLLPYIIVSYDSVKEAIHGIKEGNIFNENVLMLVASIGAMLIGFLPDSKPEFTEAIFVMLFFQVGELFEIIAEGKSEKSIKSLMEIRPDYANVVMGNEIKVISPSEVKIDDVILIKPGEKVPLDGIVIEGNSSVNTVALTGESVPRTIREKDEIFSGFVNESGSLKVKVTKTFENSTASKIIDLVKNASNKKSSSEKFISKFSKIYTPIVIFSALIIGIIPSIITHEYIIWIFRALTFLVVSCPCALVISVPLAYFGGIGDDKKKGVLFKGSNYLEMISKLGIIVFDKTGTLTKGVFEVTAIHPKTLSERELLHIASHVESLSTHPIATSLIKSYNKDNDLNDNCKISNVKEIAVYGLEAKVNDKLIYVGNSKLMDKINIECETCKKVGTIIHIASKDEYYGHIVISDEIKDDTKEAIEYFKKVGIKTVMLTGDSKVIAEDVAKNLNIDEYHAELLPNEKVEIVDKLVLQNQRNNKKNIGFVGDGINDAPVITRCDIGISMGSIGSDAAIEASDVVLMQDKLSSLIDAIKISKKTSLIAKQNIIFSILVKISVLVLSAFGITNMWMAVFADVGVTILAVLNSIRTLK